MGENRETIIIDVEMDAKKLAKELGSATEQVRILKAEQKLLDKAFAEGNISAENYGKIIAENKAEMEKAQRTIKSNTALLQANEVQTVSNTESLDVQRQKLNTLQKAYANMSEAQKNAVVDGKTLTERIKELSDSIKEQEHAIGDDRRNVGNYTESIVKAGDTLRNMFSVMKQGKTPMESVKLGLNAIGKTPVLFVVTSLVKVIQILSEKFRGNAAAMESLTKVFGLFNGVGVLVDKLIDSLAKGLGKLVDWTLKAADAMGLVTDEMREAQRIAQSELDMNAKQRESARQNAEDMQAIAELRAKANEKDKVGTAERLRLLDEANKKEEAIAKRNADLAREAYELQVAKNAQSESSQEDLNRENDLYIQMLNAQTSYLQKQREIQGQMAELREKQRKEVEDAAAVRLEIERKLQDAMIALDRDAVTRQINQLRVAGEREVENLKIKLRKLKQTDTKARAELQQLIVEREKQTQQQIDAVTTQAAEQRAQALRQNAYTEQQLLTSDVLKLAQFREAQAQQEFTRLTSMTEEQRQVLFANREAYEAAILEAEKRWSDERLAVQQEEYARRQQAEQNEYERRLQNILEGDDVALAEAELARAMDENEQLMNMDAATKAMLFKSQEAYEAAVIASENKIVAAKRKALDETRKMAQQNAMAVAGVLGAISGLLDEFGEQNEAAAKASKAIALGKIAVETGVAIAQGTAQAQSVPFPANIAAIATTVATVLANIATAISTVKSAKFSTGGVVGGGSYGQGDTVNAMLSPQEVVLNPTQTAQTLFAIANGAQVGSSAKDMADVVVAAVAAQPAPVLVYDEFENFNNKRVTYNEFAKI